MQLKVCGMKYEENIIEVLTKLRPNYMGFIFYAQSPRYMANHVNINNILPYKANTLFIGVFVNEPIENIIEAISTYCLDGVQLHGNESPETCALLQQHTTVWKAFGIDETFDFNTLTPYEPVVNAFLFDTKTSKHGGSGKLFNWDILSQYNSTKPYILSGGVHTDNYKQVKSMNNTPLIIDVNSKFEIAPALKNVTALLELKNIL
jgi:phosphoribosylanthranilate isomerase